MVADTTKRKFKRFQIGALIGPDIIRLDVEKNSTTQNVEVNNALGFHLGIACRLNFSKRFYLLPQASLAFRATSITYNQNGLTAKEDFAPLTLECPVHFVFKTHPDKRFTLAFHAGGRFIGDISKKKEDPIGIRRGDVAVEAGAGFEFRIWKITLMPQVGTSIGLTNLVSGGNVVDNIRRQKFELRFLFF